MSGGSRQVPSWGGGAAPSAHTARGTRRPAFASMEPLRSELAAWAVPRLRVYGDRGLSAQAPAVSKHTCGETAGSWWLRWPLVSSVVESGKFVYRASPCELQMGGRLE